jgi:hypothetical protein
VHQKYAADPVPLNCHLWLVEGLANARGSQHE